MYDSKEGFDGEYEYGMRAVNDTMANWKRWYCKKNSPNKIEFRLRSLHHADNPKFFKHYIELVKTDKMIEQHRILNEVYDAFDKDESLPKTDYSGVGFITLFTFNHIIKKPKNE